MRILTVTHFFETHGGGIERVGAHLNRGLAQLGFETWWAASDADDAPSATTAQAIALTCFDPLERLVGLPMPLPSPGALRALVRAVRESDAVIVHDSLYVTSIAAMLAARVAGKPVLLVQHIASIPFRSAAMRGAMRLADAIVTRAMLRSADQVVFISATVQAAFADVKTGRAPRLVFNGVDANVFRPDETGEARGKVRRELAVPEHSPLALFVGRFVEKKGLAALAQLARARPDLTIVLAGRGPIDPEGWGLPNVRVVRDRRDGALAALYQAADMLLLPSVGEGYPLVVQEAMACGLPVICGDEAARADPGAAQWLTGIAVDPADPAGTAARASKAIDGLHATASTRAAMAAYAAAHYSWDAAARTVADLLIEDSQRG